MKAGIDRHSRTFLWLCPISFQNIKFGLLGAGDGHSACPWSNQIESDISGTHTFIGVHIVLVFAVTVSIYHSALEMLLACIKYL